MHRDALDDAGVVDKDVYLSYLLMNALYKGGHGLLVRNVAYVAVHVGDAGLAVGVQPFLH